MTIHEAEQLFTENMKLAYHVLHRNYPLFGQNEDMQQEALLGLWKACLSYDRDKGQFSTYAGQCILNQLRGVMRNQHKQPETIPLSQLMNEDGSTLGRTLEGSCFGVDEGLIYLKEFLANLPERELKLLQLTAAGLTQTEIGQQLGRSRTWCSRTLRRLQQDYLKQEDQNE